jgi:formylglycine-generating enzyme required for sulfatase activity/serine/threonine protein kinase
MDPHSAVHPTDQTLSAYGLGKLDDGLAAEVNKHLEQCPDCRKRVAEMSADSFLERARGARQPADDATSGQSQAGGYERQKRADLADPPLPGALPPELAEHADYEITRELGRGGMGVVYLAQNRLMGRPEVLKVVIGQLINRPGVLERFLREIRSAARLRHANIVTAYAARRIGESLVLAMEYVDGLDLARMVKAMGPLPVAHACNFVYQAALGLQHAHEHGMVHRDIKPANLILSHAGKRAVIKVLDFGLAKVTSEGQVDSSLTREGQMLGTPDYIAPEQIRDAQSADIRADIYSLGCTLYYLLTGRPPFAGDNLWDLYQAHFSMDAAPLNLVRADVPDELSALVAKMMAKDPARRFQTPREVGEALGSFFKKGNQGSVGLKPEISQLGLPDALGPASQADQTPPRPHTDPARAAGKPAVAAQAGSILEGLIDLRETEPLFDTMLDSPRPASTPKLIQRGRLAWTTEVQKLSGLRRWHWWTIAGVLLFGLVLVCAAVIFKIRTKDGVIVLEELPNDAEVLLDGEHISVTWPGEGKPAEFKVPAGRRGIEVQLGGIKIFGEEVSIEAGDQKKFRVRLEPRRAPNIASDAADRTQKPVVTADQTPMMIENSIGMRLRLIPAGEFLMGSPDDDKRAPANEKPQHRVRITQPFYLGVTEVTRGQFRRFVEANGYRTEAERDGKGAGGWNEETKRYELNSPKLNWRNPGGFQQTDQHPVVSVSWKDAVEFAAWLSSKERRTYRLPSEAEWEYACQAGSPPLQSSTHDANALGEYVRHIDDSSAHTHVVEQMRPNAMGLYGMSGNASEWCADLYDGIYYASSPAADPPGATHASAHVLRGGNYWDNGPLCVRPAYRNVGDISFRAHTAGFRLALNPSGMSTPSINRSSEPTNTAGSNGGFSAIAGTRPTRAAAATELPRAANHGADGSKVGRPPAAPTLGVERVATFALSDRTATAGQTLRLPLGPVELRRDPPPAGVAASFRIAAPFRTKSPIADGAISPDEYGPPLAIDFTDDKNPGLDVFLAPNPAKSAKDLSADLYLAYTRDALFVAVKVWDDVVIDRPDAGLPANDGIELFLDGDRFGGDLKPGSREGFQAASTARGRKYATGVGTSDQDYSVKTSTFEGGYIVEFRIPLATIDVVDGAEVSPPGPGSTLRFNLAIIDNDKPVDTQERYCVLWSEDRTRPPLVEGDGAWPVDLHLNRPVKYDLVAGPKGAAIDPETGLFTWNAPKEPRTEKVTIRVRDAAQPEINAEASFTITISAASETTSSRAVGRPAPALPDKPPVPRIAKHVELGKAIPPRPSRVATNGLAGAQFIDPIRFGPDALGFDEPGTAVPWATVDAFAWLTTKAVLWLPATAGVAIRA